MTVNFSDGSARSFTSSYFTLDPLDMLSFSGQTIPIGGANPKPIGATLTGLFATTSVTLFDGSTMTISPDFTATIPNGGPLPDGTLAIINANPGTGPGVPEPGTWLLTIGALWALCAIRLNRLGLRRRIDPSGLPRLLSAVACGLLLSMPAWTQVKLNLSTIPNSGVAGIDFVNVIGSGFPTTHGAITPGNVTVSVATTCGGAPLATTTASSVTLILGSSDRIGFLVPGTLATATYFVSLSGTTADSTSFSSLPGSCSQISVAHTNPTLAACIPTSSLAVDAPAAGGVVTAYAPNGCWECATTGVQAVVIEGSGTNVSIPTPSVTNSCSSNPATGQTVCVANNNEVYLITGTTITNTLHSASNTTTKFSGGSCENCGVAINALTNRAVIAMGLTPSPSRSGLQFLDLNTNTFSPAIATTQEVSEDISIDPTRGLVLSPNEASNYTLFSFSGSGAVAEFGRPITPFQTLDSAAEDCSTGIALSSSEGTNNVFISDLTQATFTAGSPARGPHPARL